MLSVLTASLVSHAFAPTPQRAAIAAASFGAKKPVVVRVNLVGRYAAVLIRGAVMEGSAIRSPILVQRFSFGWQALDLLNFRCRLAAHGFPPALQDRLMQGMPKPRDDRPCSGQPRDAGPAAEVQAVRALMRGPLVPYVIVSRHWALGEWYGGGGGQEFYRRERGVWHRVAGGGGAIDFATVRALGVPYRDACKLHIYDARCQ